MTYVKNVADSEENFKLTIFKLSCNILVHILVIATVGVTVLFAFTNGYGLSGFNLHIILCTVGYQLLMAEGFLCLVPENSWTTSFRLVDKRRIHWILQVMGSGLAIAGCFLVIPLKDIHWNSLHGKYALVALVFTIVSLVNGLTSLYSYELRKYLRIPPNFSRIPHILDGVVAFAAASMSLCYGLDMEFFRVWLSPYLSTIAIVFTATFTFIIIINPMTVVYNKIMDIYRK